MKRVTRTGFVTIMVILLTPFGALADAKDKEATDVGNVAAPHHERGADRSNAQKEEGAPRGHERAAEVRQNDPDEKARMQAERKQRAEQQQKMTEEQRKALREKRKAEWEERATKKKAEMAAEREQQMKSGATGAKHEAGKAGKAEKAGKAGKAETSEKVESVEKTPTKAMMKTPKTGE